MPETKSLHDVFRPTGSLAVLQPDHDPAHPPPHAANGAFPREADIRLAQDLLFFAYRDFTNAADVILEELGFGRAHHRALHFIGRHPGITVSELLAILRITKQSLARVLGALLDQDYVAQAQGDQDRRQRLLTLTRAGQALERRLFERQQARLAPAYHEAGSAAVDGFRSVMQLIMDEEACRNIAETHDAAPPNGTPARSVRASDSPAGAARSGDSPPGAARPGGSPSEPARTSTLPNAQAWPGGPPTNAVPASNASTQNAQSGDSTTGAIRSDDSPTGAARLAPMGQR